MDWPSDLTEDEQAEYLALGAAGFGDAGDGTWRWLPEPGVLLRCMNGNMAGGGPMFVPDGKGGGVLKVRSKVTLRWRESARVTPYSV